MKTTPPKNVLVVSFQYGEAGETGGFRWAKMLPVLVDHGWTATVITRDGQPNCPEREGIDVLSVPYKHPATHAFLGVLRLVKAILRYTRVLPKTGRNAARTKPAERQRADEWSDLPSAAIRDRVEQLRLPMPGDRKPLHANVHRLCEGLDYLLWAFRAYRTALAMSRSHQGRWSLVVVSSPPHWTQFCGVWLARRLGIPFVADLRDPWIAALTDECIADSPLARIDLRVERRVQKSASLVVFNTEVARRMSCESRGAGTDFRSVAIGNGYDVESFPASSLDFERFRIVFAGHVYPHMDVRVLFRAIERLIAANTLDPKELSLELLGSGQAFNGIPFSALARAHGIEAYVEVMPRVERDLALRYQSRASVLVAMDYPYPSAIVMKAYDYLCMPGFMLALTHPGSALGAMLDELGLESFDFKEEDRIQAFLQDCFERWRARELPGAKDPLRKHSRKHRSHEMLAALEEILSGDGKARP